MIIEKTILDYLLGQQITDIGDKIYLETPTEPPQEYVLIEKTGTSSYDRHIECATIAIQSISSQSLYRAAVINDRIREAMKQISDDTQIYRCDLNTDYNFTNTATKQYRYQAVFQLYF